MVCADLQGFDLASLADFVDGWYFVGDLRLGIASGCCDCVFVDSVVVLRVNSVGVMLLYYFVLFDCFGSVSFDWWVLGGVVVVLLCCVWVTVGLLL